MNTQPLIGKGNRNLRGFTLVELMTASVIALIITGSAVMLLFYSSREGMKGICNATVEETAYIIQNNLINTIRSMSAANGMTPDTVTACYDSNSNLLGYRAIYTFTVNSNNALTTSRFYYDTNASAVVYVPDITQTNTKVYWGTNSKYCKVQNLYFTSSYNLDGSFNSSLVNCFLQVSDNSWSTNSNYGAPNDAATIFRTFSVLMRAN